MSTILTRLRVVAGPSANPAFLVQPFGSTILAMDFSPSSNVEKKLLYSLNSPIYMLIVLRN